jgi:putative DNA methylase
VANASACSHPLPDDSAAALVTDPPYYDAVPYADLSDFFFVWLKRSLSNVDSSFNQDLTPKDGECIVDTASPKISEDCARMGD